VSKRAKTTRLRGDGSSAGGACAANATGNGIVGPLADARGTEARVEPERNPR
jgi:hypothetical protein